MKPRLILLLIALPVYLEAQTTIELSFSATYEGQYIAIDSILVENTTQGGEMMLYSDTLLTLEATSGVRDINSLPGNKVYVYQNFPNPAAGKTTIDIYLPEEDVLSLQALDIHGRELFCSSEKLSKGIHSYDFYPGKEKLYLIKASDGNTYSSIKVLNAQAGGANTCSLIYKAKTEVSAYHKSFAYARDFPFYPGDVLSFTGYASNLLNVLCSDVVEDAPQTNTAYTFNMKEGVACDGLASINYEGKTYSSVQIGEQCWLRENLDVGTMIQSTDPMQNNSSVEKYCYNNNAANCDVYGGLYQWDEMMNYSNSPASQGICPDGWHIPTIAEWTILIDFLGDYPSEKLKKPGTSLWGCSNDMATNESGFTGIPGGAFMDWSGSFMAITMEGDHWSSDDFGTTNGACRGLVCNGIYIMEGSYDKHSAISVRCIKND